MTTGSMQKDYASGRENYKPLIFRFKVRALTAIQEFLKRTPKTGEFNLLDLGCAEGATLNEMANLVSKKGSVGKVDGVEYSQELLGIGQQKYPNLRLKLGDIQKLDEAYLDQSYDLVIIMAVIEHIENPEACLKDAAKAMTPDGVIVASCPNPFWDEVSGTLGLHKDEHHVGHYTLKDLEALFEKSSFTVVESRKFMWAPIAIFSYLGINVSPKFSITIDRFIEKLKIFNFLFVNQLIVAKKG